MGVAAFTVDYGRAYASKRQLQNAADAGSLAAASFYTDKLGTCSTLSANTSYLAQARDIALDIIDESRPGAVLDNFEVGCNADDELTVEASTTGNTGTALGGVFGASTVWTQRQAEATMEVATGAGRGLRPYAMCSHDIPSPVPSDVVKVGFPGQADMAGPCPTANNPGNWWTINCPEDSNNSNANLAVKTEHGCDSPVTIVAGQPEVEPSAADNEDLRAHLVAACSTGTENDCLYADPGNINGAPVMAAWETLLGKTVLLPVFCGNPTCDPAAVAPAGGNNVKYPVHKFVSVVICGFHWAGSPDSHFGSTTSGDCSTNTFDASAGNSANYLLLRFTNVQVTGSTDDGDCAIGDPNCDGGPRQVRLTE